MSFRLFAHRLIRNGRHILYNYCTKRDIHINILERKNNRILPRSSGPSKKDGTFNVVDSAFRNNAIFRFGQQARRLFVDNILNRVTPIYSANLRNEATKKFLHGDSGPLFALIGISLASGTGILTKDDELEGVCWEIREAVSRLHERSVAKEKVIDKDDLNLDSLNIGPPIAKGCSAVVYAASYKNFSKPAPNLNESCESESSVSSLVESNVVPIENTSRFIHHFGSSLENSHFLRESPLTQQMRNNQRQVRFNSKQNMVYQNSVDGNSFDDSEENASFESIAKMVRIDDPDDMETYPLALKMMFNYDIQSNAMSILRAMYKETIPAIHRYEKENIDGWEKSLMEQTVSLPPHPNIVMMFGVFCAQIPNLKDSSTLYPMALPQRLNPYGYGRNMSLFLLMKRYEHNLCSYLEAPNEITMRTRILLFAQLLEACAHLYRHGVAHRDLKSDNILVDLNGNDRHPVLVLSDFGCCLADKTHGLCIPYTSMDFDKGGNTALMAPEIINKLPGTFSILDYSKSDLWACGAIAYEIFGQRNPFYNDDKGSSDKVDKELRNTDYCEEDLPSMNQSVPLLIKKLVENILQRNPNKRLSPDIAANVIQLFLWAPSSWLKSYTNVSSPEILQWLISLTTKVLYEGRMGHTENDTKNSNPFDRIQKNRTYTEFLLLTSFLIRTQLQQIRVALNWIHSMLDTEFTN